ncbi:MAG: DNA repair protein RadC [Spirochaetales bacterium]|nr:DNA repair protein RadC [Spirochaetales bacterium]
MNVQEMRPREKLMARGLQTLSDHELLQGIIGSGNSRRNVRQLAADVLRLMDTHGGLPGIDTIKDIPGMGKAKASIIVCAFELAKRRMIPPNICIKTPEDILQFLLPYRNKKQEHFLVAGLSGSHELKYLDVITIGILNKSLVHPREVYERAITSSIHSILVCHNHPSGNLQPSKEDKEVTRRLKETGEIIGIPLIDHIIIGPPGHFSFLEHNML